MCALGLYFFVGILLYSATCDYLEEDDGDWNEDDVNNFVASLKDDANLDLSLDQEYEDLRTELRAFHGALDQLRSEDARKSLLNTPCWKMGGICVHHDLCEGSRFLTQVRGCKNKLNVCCFRWNQFRIRDLRDKGAGFIGYPWSPQTPYILNKNGMNKKPAAKKTKKKKNKKMKGMKDGGQNKERKPLEEINKK